MLNQRNVSPKITRVYHYQWYPDKNYPDYSNPPKPPNRRWDSALKSDVNTRNPALTTFVNRACYATNTLDHVTWASGDPLTSCLPAP